MPFQSYLCAFFKYRFLMAALQFELQHTDHSTKARTGKITTDHGEILTPIFMKTYRRHAIVLIMVVAAIITPADVLSMLMAAFPLLILYEFSIIMCNITYKKVKKIWSKNMIARIKQILQKFKCSIPLQSRILSLH